MLQLPLGQILLRDARVEEVDRSCDSETDSDDTSLPDYTLAIWPVTSGPTYLMIPTKHEKVTTANKTTHIKKYMFNISVSGVSDHLISVLRLLLLLLLYTIFI